MNLHIFGILITKNCGYFTRLIPTFICMTMYEMSIHAIAVWNCYFNILKIRHSLDWTKKIFVGSKTLNKFHTNGCMHIHMIIRFKQSRALNKAAIFIDLFLLIHLDLIHVLINKSLHSFLAKNPSYSYGHSSWFYLT